MKIAVLFGGTSEERDVSIASAAQIIPALRNLGHEVFAVDTATGRLGFAEERRLLSAAVGALPPSDTEIARMRSGALAFTPAADFRDADVVFLALHGGAGEDGRVQALLDLAGCVHRQQSHRERRGDGQGLEQAIVSLGRRSDAGLADGAGHGP